MQDSIASEDLEQGHHFDIVKLSSSGVIGFTLEKPCKIGTGQLNLTAQFMVGEV
ncbi:MAG TPA: hypothetical protein VHP38_07485 [Ruminiclostridium sp.]|nr:hypothetical protein [Ruminiclostridium sp.]